MSGDQGFKDVKQAVEAIKRLTVLSNSFSSQTHMIFSNTAYYNANMKLALKQLRVSIAGGQGRKVRKYAAIQYDYYYRAMLSYMVEMTKLGELTASLKALDEVKKNLPSIGHYSDWDKLQKIIDAAVARDELDSTISRIKAISGKAIAKKYENFIKTREKRAEMALERHLPTLLGAIYAMAVAHFNLECLQPGNELDTTAGQQWCKAQNNTIETVLNSTHKLLANHQYQDIKLLVKSIREQFKPAIIAGVTNAALLHKKLAADNSASDDIYMLGCAIGDALRNWLKLYTLSFILESIAVNPHSKLAAQWSKSAGEIKLDLLQQPTPLSLSDLLSKNSLTADEKISVVGRVTDVVILYHGKHYISFAQLEDGKGNSITAVLPYIKIESVGIDPGCSLCLSGNYNSDISKYLFKVPPKYQPRTSQFSKDCIIIDRLNLTELQKDNWLYWLDNHLRPYFTEVPHGLAVSWSWLPGTKGAGNSLRFGNWFDPRTKPYDRIIAALDEAEADSRLCDEALLADCVNGDTDKFAADLVKSITAEKNLQAICQDALIDYPISMYDISDDGAGSDIALRGNWNDHGDQDDDPDPDPDPNDPWPDDPGTTTNPGGPTWSDDGKPVDGEPEPEPDPDPVDWSDDPSNTEPMPDPPLDCEELDDDTIPPDAPDDKDWSWQGGPPEPPASPDPPWNDFGPN
ncbi:MAG TPA: hypothetical protein VN426_00480 [Syntrophomonadaceae bacterium]|nr:hypothetical protein [Syntrophomonadaceae bacterium]